MAFEIIKLTYLLNYTVSNGRKLPMARSLSTADRFNIFIGKAIQALVGSTLPDTAGLDLDMIDGTQSQLHCRNVDDDEHERRKNNAITRSTYVCRKLSILLLCFLNFDNRFLIFQTVELPLCENYISVS